MKKLTPYQRIMRASKRGTGLRLSAKDVRDLASDPAVALLAMHEERDTDT